MQEEKICKLENCSFCSRKEYWETYRLMKFKCAWCKKKIYNDKEKYLLKGNMCSTCNEDINFLMKKELEEHNESSVFA